MKSAAICRLFDTYIHPILVRTRAMITLLAIHTAAVGQSLSQQKRETGAEKAAGAAPLVAAFPRPKKKNGCWFTNDHLQLCKRSAMCSMCGFLFSLSIYIWSINQLHRVFQQLRRVRYTSMVVGHKTCHTGMCFTRRNTNAVGVRVCECMCVRACAYVFVCLVFLFFLYVSFNVIFQMVV